MKITLAAILACIFDSGLTQVLAAEGELPVDEGKVLSDSTMENMRGGIGLDTFNTGGLLNGILASAQTTASPALNSALAMCGNIPSCNVSINSTTTDPGSLSALNLNLSRAFGGSSQSP